MTHVFDQAIELTAQSDGRYLAHTHPAYNNMVGPFGGITAATVVDGLQRHPESAGEPVAFTINYVAPISEGEWILDPVLVRTNRTNQHWTFSIEQAGVVVATGSAVQALRRETWADTEATPPSAGQPADYPAVDFPEFIAWAGNYEKRFVVGGLADGQQTPDSRSTLWLRDLPERHIDYPALASMADAFFPRVFLRHGIYMPAGTITMTTYFHASPDELAAQGSAPVLATAQASRFGNGHFDQSGQLWGVGDTLLASTHQLVYYKDPRG